MEILFSIILIVYFIVSAINKSKKKGEVPPYVPPSNRREQQNIFTDNSIFGGNSNDDILAEMDRILRSSQTQYRTEPATPKPEPVINEFEDKAEKYAPEVFTPPALKVERLVLEDKTLSQKEEVKTVFVQQSNKEFGIEQNYERKDSVFTLSNYGRRIKGHLQTPATARDFVIVAEILNSPKFRRARL